MLGLVCSQKAGPTAFAKYNQKKLLINHRQQLFLTILEQILAKQLPNVTLMILRTRKVVRSATDVTGESAGGPAVLLAGGPTATQVVEPMV